DHVSSPLPAATIHRGGESGSGAHTQGSAAPTRTFYVNDEQNGYGYDAPAATSIVVGGKLQYALPDDLTFSQNCLAAYPHGVPDFPSQGPSNRFYNDHEVANYRSLYTPTANEPDEWTEQAYERVLDLIPDGNDRELVKRVRKVQQETEVGEDTTSEEWITVRGNGQRITWGGRMESDYANWLNDSDFDRQQSYFEFRRLRLSASGEGYGVYDYQLEFEFSPDRQENLDLPGEAPAVAVQDAYLGLKDLPFFGYVMIGNYRAPIGLSNITSTRFETFMERSLSTRLLPGRQVGIAAYNRSQMYATTWAYGAFFYDLDESSHHRYDNNQGARFISRATWTPLYDEATGGQYVLHTGLGYSFNRPQLEDGPVGGTRAVRFSARPEIHQSDRLIDTLTMDVQGYHVLNGELAWVNGPWSVQSEMNWLSLDRNGAKDADLYGAYVQTSYFLTGEHRPYDRNYAVFRRVVPYENFWAVRTARGTQAGYGAWEVAFRWSYLSFADLNGQYLNDLTTGINWYWNPQVRVMANWIHSMAHASPIGNQLDAQGDVLAMRLQVDF
ncbi:MAG: hypothetical protein KDB23_20615, partial [Planctomycetales bacterium]|nr:hypothetical protein [Planctomycetales bacterium]